MATLDIAPDWLVQGIIGIVAGGAMIRSFLVSWSETRAKLRSGDQVSDKTIISAVQIGWSKDQIERALQSIETIAAAAATYDHKTRDATSATLLENNRLLERLLRKMDDAEEDAVQRRLDRNR